MATAPCNTQTSLVKRIRFARASLRVTTDLQKRRALLAELAAVTNELADHMLEPKEIRATSTRR